jgi:hypothetical protein
MFTTEYVAPIDRTGLSKSLGVVKPMRKQQDFDDQDIEIFLGTTVKEVRNSKEVHLIFVGSDSGKEFLNS